MKRIILLPKLLLIVTFLLFIGKSLQATQCTTVNKSSEHPPCEAIIIPTNKQPSNPSTASLYTAICPYTLKEDGRLATKQWLVTQGYVRSIKNIPHIPQEFLCLITYFGTGKSKVITGETHSVCIRHNSRLLTLLVDRTVKIYTRHGTSCDLLKNIGAEKAPTVCVDSSHQIINIWNPNDGQSIFSPQQLSSAGNITWDHSGTRLATCQTSNTGIYSQSINIWDNDSQTTLLQTRTPSDNLQVKHASTPPILRKNNIYIYNIYSQKLLLTLQHIITVEKFVWHYDDQLLQFFHIAY